MTVGLGLISTNVYFASTVKSMLNSLYNAITFFFLKSVCSVAHADEFVNTQSRPWYLTRFCALMQKGMNHWFCWYAKVATESLAVQIESTWK